MHSKADTLIGTSLSIPHHRSQLYTPCWACPDNSCTALPWQTLPSAHPSPQQQHLQTVGSNMDTVVFSTSHSDRLPLWAWSHREKGPVCSASWSIRNLWGRTQSWPGWQAPETCNLKCVTNERKKLAYSNVKGITSHRVTELMCVLKLSHQSLKILEPSQPARARLLFQVVSAAESHGDTGCALNRMNTLDWVRVIL